jgi:hypothetical protein
MAVALPFRASSQAPHKWTGEETPTPSSLETGVDVNARYAWRIPDWLWKDERRQSLVSRTDRDAIEYDIKVLAALQQLDDSSAGDSKELEIARRLSRIFSVRDLSAGGSVFRNCASQTAICVQVDPEFDEPSRKTLVAATDLFLRFALDDEVIDQALETSISNPEPMPPKHAADGSSTELTPAYKFYLNHRSRPDSAEEFKSHVRLALSSPTGDPALLCLSQYRGNHWWGGAYYDFVHANEQQLSRFSPGSGFLFIRLNSDKLKEPEPLWNDAAFWAGKIAHEVLHNLGYWHPPYTDAAHRDANNQGNQKAFIVAYERLVYEKARSCPGGPTDAPGPCAGDKEAVSHCLGNAANEKAKKVVEACEKHWENNKRDCNKFLKAVAGELGITDFASLGNADSIVNYLEGTPSGWTKLKRGEHNTAHSQAVAGKFVVAGLLSGDVDDDNGHVTVVTCGDKVHSGGDGIAYPRGYWGTLGGVGKQCEGMNYSFPAPARKELRYYYRDLP